MRVIENLESHGIWSFHFPGYESPEIEVWVMESHGKAINYLRTNSQKKIESWKPDKSENQLILVKKKNNMKIDWTIDCFENALKLLYRSHGKFGKIMEKVMEFLEPRSTNVKKKSALRMCVAYGSFTSDNTRYNSSVLIITKNWPRLVPRFVFYKLRPSHVAVGRKNDVHLSL